MHWFPDPADDPFFADALCNDGTKGGYYYAPSTVADAADTYVIHLPGGGQCYDEESCQARWEVKRSSMSSSQLTPTKAKKGFMDSALRKTPFYGAHKAMLGYCSSDGYMGDVGASAATWGWHFRGQRLVFGFVKRLVEAHGLSSSSTIVFSGGSAGARGVMVLIDLLVRDHFPPGAKVVGFLDSPYYIDVAPYNPLYPGFAYEEQMKYLHMNTRALVPDDCAARYAGEEWKCQVRACLRSRCDCVCHRAPYNVFVAVWAVPDAVRARLVLPRHVAVRQLPAADGPRPALAAAF